MYAFYKKDVCNFTWDWQPLIVERNPLVKKLLIKFLEILRNFQANIYWPSKSLEDIFKTKNFLFPRALDDLLKTSHKTSCGRLKRHLGRQKNVTLKTSSRRPEGMSCRHLQDMSSRRLEGVLKDTNKTFTRDSCF